MSDHIGMAPNRIRFGASGSGGRRARRQARWHLLRKPPAERLCPQNKHLPADPSASPAQAQRTQGGLPHARTRHPRHPELAVLSVRLGLSGWQSSFGRCFSPPLPGRCGNGRTGPAWRDWLPGPQRRRTVRCPVALRWPRPRPCTTPPRCTLSPRLLPRQPTPGSSPTASSPSRPSCSPALPSTSSDPKPSRPVTEGTRPDSHDQQGETPASQLAQARVVSQAHDR